MNTKSFYRLTEMVPLDQIITEDLQRSISPAHVADIIQNWDSNLYDLPTLRLLPSGKYSVDRGQHRVAALREQGYTEATFAIIIDVSDEQAAEHFSREDKIRKPTSQIDRFNADVRAKNPVAMQIKDIIEHNGFCVSHNCIAAIDTVRRIVHMFGTEVFDTALACINGAWGTQDRSCVLGVFLTGVSQFVFDYSVSAPSFQARFMKVPPSNIMYKLRSRLGHDNAQLAFDEQTRNTMSQILVTEFNRGLGSKSKLRLIAKA